MQIDTAFIKAVGEIFFYQEPKKIWTIWIKNLNSIVSKINNTNSLTILMRPNNAIKLNIVELDKCETYPVEEVLPEDDFYRYLYQPGEQKRNKKI